MNKKKPKVIADEVIADELDNIRRDVMNSECHLDLKNITALRASVQRMVDSLTKIQQQLQ